MKVLASDFDGTLYVKDKEVVLRNIEAIKDFVKQGNLFGVVTGRNYSNLKKLLNEYQIPYHYLICLDGAKVFDSMDYCFATVYLSKEDIIQIIPVLEQYNFSYYLDDGYNETTNMDDCVRVVGIIGERRKDAEKVVEMLSKLGFYAYLSTEHINVINSKANKKEALEKILVHADCSKNSLYVIGDSVNDYEMLSAYQGGVMKEHGKELNVLDKKSYDTLYSFIEELEKK